MAKLVEISGYTPGREILVGEQLLLGRDPGDGGLVIANREASRRHAQIRRRGNEFVVEDLNSSNGTYVNGVRRPLASLLEGTLITVGRTTFKFSLEPARSISTLSSIPSQALPAPEGSTPNAKALEVETLEAGDDDTNPQDVTISRIASGSSIPPRSTSPGARNIAGAWNDIGGVASLRLGPSAGAIISPPSQAPSSSQSSGSQSLNHVAPGSALPRMAKTPSSPGAGARPAVANVDPRLEPRLESRTNPPGGIGSPGPRLDVPTPGVALLDGSGHAPVPSNERPWLNPDDIPPRTSVHEAAYRPIPPSPGNARLSNLPGLAPPAGMSATPAVMASPASGLIGEPELAVAAPTRPQPVIPERRKSPVWNMMLDARATRMGEAVGQGPESLQHERDILHHLCEISRTLGSILHLPALVHEILLKAFELFPAAENASIHLLDRELGLQPLAARSRSGGEIVPPPISQTIANMALSDRQSILSTDAAGDERFLNKQSIILHRVRSFMCSPLLFRDEALGVLYVDTTDARPRFTAEDLRLFTAVSAQVAVAVKNSQLMSENLREAEVRLHLSRYLPPGLVDQVINKQIDITPGGSLYEGTVLFSDVVGFTPMSERLGPVQLVTTLNRYFRHMVEVIFRYNGSVNKFGGDSIMALWGVPVKQGDDVLKAVCAAVEMQVAIFGFNLAVPDESEPLRVGIGLNTGTFVMGNVGSMQHMEYTALGNHVNLAQRVESQASGMQVFLSENTWQRVADKVSVFELPPRLLKGVSVPLPIYSVRAVRWQDTVICAVPGMLQWSSGMTAPCILSRVFADQSFEVWTGRRPEAGTELLLRLDAPEHPAITVLNVMVESSIELVEFTQDSSHQGWKCRMSATTALPSLFAPPSVQVPKSGYEYRSRT